MVTCPSCGQENPDGFRYCGACATPLAQDAPAAREERKVVTVLFCDLVGSTARAERLDPEDVRALLSRYHERVRSELERFGGTVEKFIGDAVMALFGAPVAHEDDPERAVRAALAILEWAGEDGGLQVRIGLTTGEALVALGARPSAGEGMASGDVVNTAARLQSAAPVNGILVDETTFRATDRTIEYGERRQVEAKGKERPIDAWQVVQARSRLGVDVRQIGATPLFGRERERAALTDALARVKDERSAQLVTLVGVPGIGKSRLVWELLGHIEGGSDLVTWRQGRSLPYGEGVAFWALGEIVKAQAGILETDTELGAAAKLGRAVRTLVADEADAEWIERHLRPLVGLESGTGERDEAFTAWRRFLEALGGLRPLVLVFEDLHFADEDLLDFVDHLADWARGVPILLIGTARPELFARRPAWGGGKANAVTISLPPLSDDDTALLVHALLDRTVLDAELRQTLLERAGGNPLYAEEFARLVALGREPATIPETVQGIVAARLDLLDAEEKRPLQDAAVVGKVFWLGTLASMNGGGRRELEQRLHTLERKELVRRERASSVAGETEYAFRHILVRDVAYAQIPRAERADKHRRAAEWIESLGRPEDHAELLADHYLSALELAAASGAETDRFAERARKALRVAGDRALALNAHRSAIRFYAAALELWPEDDASLPQLLLSFGRALAPDADDRAEVALERARAGLIAAGDATGAAEAVALLAELSWHSGRRAAASQQLQEARRLVDGATASPSKAWVLAHVSRYQMVAGETEGAVEAGREALAMAEELGLEEVRAQALNNIGCARCNSGDPDGVHELEQSIEIAAAANSPELARAYNNLANNLRDLGHVERGLALLREAVRVADKFGNRRFARFSSAIVAYGRYYDGGWDEFVASAHAFLEESERLGGSYQDAFFVAGLAVVEMARGDDEGALARARRAVEYARGARDRQLMPMLAQVALVELEAGSETDARARAVQWQELEDGAGGSGRVDPLRLDPTIALVAEALGIEAELRPFAAAAPPENLWAPPMRAVLDGELVAAAEAYERTGYPLFGAIARLRAGERLHAEGRAAEAEEQLALALAFWRRVGATRYVRRAEAITAPPATRRASSP